MKIMDLPMEERPLEKMMTYGPKHLSNTELLAVIIRTGHGNESAISLSERILSSSSDGLIGLMTVSPEELMDLKGIGRTKACAVAAVGELSRRISRSNFKDRGSISTAGDAVDLFMEDLRFEKKEHFRALLLDVKGKIIGIEDPMWYD